MHIYITTVRFIRIYRKNNINTTFILGPAVPECNYTPGFVFIEGYVLDHRHTQDLLLLPVPLCIHVVHDPVLPGHNNDIA